MSDTIRTSPHDTLVGLVGKAIDTGRKVEARRSPRDNAFYAGRISAFVYAAAMLADQMYGCTFADVRHRILKEVEDVHLSWNDADLADPARVGERATAIVVRVLLAGTPS